MNTIIEKIRAEVERQIALLPTVGYSTQIAGDYIPVQNTLNYLLSFLSDLEKEEKPFKEPIDGVLYAAACGIKNKRQIEKTEKPSEGVEEEIERYLHSLGVGYGGWVDGMEDDDLRGIARHFYELGCRRTAEKYDEIEYKRQRAEESVPKDLEEAARRYGFEEYMRRCNGGEYGTSEDTFIAGAKWQKEKMMKEAVEGCVTMYANKIYPTLIGIRERIGDTGDKVKIIIVKEDKK